MGSDSNKMSRDEYKIVSKKTREERTRYEQREVERIFKEDFLNLANVKRFFKESKLAECQLTNRLNTLDMSKQDANEVYETWLQIIKLRNPDIKDSDIPMYYKDIVDVLKDEDVSKIVTEELKKNEKGKSEEVKELDKQHDFYLMQERCFRNSLFNLEIKEILSNLCTSYDGLSNQVVRDFYARQGNVNDRSKLDENIIKISLMNLERITTEYIKATYKKY